MITNYRKDFFLFFYFLSFYLYDSTRYAWKALFRIFIFLLHPQLAKAPNAFLLNYFLSLFSFLSN